MTVIAVNLPYALAKTYERLSLIEDLPNFVQNRYFSKLSEIVTSNPRMQIAKKLTVR